MEIEVETPIRFDVSVPDQAVNVSMPTGPSSAAVVVVPGSQGPAGADGTLWFTGHGPPGVLVGSHPGDFYMDLDDGTIYELGGS